MVAALAREGVHVEPGRFGPDALVVLDGNPLLTPLAGDGSFFVQDEASQLVALARRRTAGRADPRCLRVAGRQDHRDGGRHGRMTG